jgi:hypothetical protein
VQDPLATTILRCEARDVIPFKGGVGQLAYDLGIEDAGHRLQHEMKSNPTGAEIKALAARLAHLRSQDVRLKLCHGNDTPWSDVLVALVRDAAEAGEDDSRLLELVRASGDTRRMELLAEVGDEPAALLRRMAAPEHRSPLVVEEQLQLYAQVLAPPGMSHSLVEAVKARLNRGFVERESIPIAELEAHLDQRGLLKASAAIMPLVDGGDLHPALFVLQRCPVPLVRAALAAGLEIDVASLTSLLSDHIAASVVLEVGDRLFCPRPPQLLASSSKCEQVSAGTLAALLAMPLARHGDRVRQAPNVVALAEVCMDHHPHLVAGSFRNFDKAVKASGNLTLVRRLARHAITATRATGQVVAGSVAEAEKTALFLRAHARICGTSWVAQRTGELDIAMSEMAQARIESDVAESADNLAFIDKCTGRFKRLQAERFLADGDGASAAHEFASSMVSLARGYEQFEKLAASADYPHLDEEPGECQTLLARTYLSNQQLDLAQETNNLAHRLLDGLSMPRKAWGDACLVDAEISLARARSGDEAAEVSASRLAEQLKHVTEIQVRFSPTGKDNAFDPGASEIIARAHRVAAGLYEALGSLSTAREELQEAARLFEELELRSEAYGCLWQATLLGDPVPEGLQEALKRQRADAATSVEALHAHSLTGCGGDQSVGYWDSVVSQGRRHAVSRMYPWRDRSTG